MKARDMSAEDLTEDYRDLEALPQGATGAAGLLNRSSNREVFPTGKGKNDVFGNEGEHPVGTEKEREVSEVDDKTLTDEFDISTPEGRYLARAKSFVIRDRNLGDSLQRTWDKYASDYVVDVPAGPGFTAVSQDAKPLSFKRLFKRDSLVRLEIGSGNGNQIVQAAATHPDRDFIAFEVYHPGVAKTISKAVKAGVTNLKIIEADAQQALPILIPAHSLDEVWTFFPDPWRKTRHHKRRLVQIEFARQVAKVLRPGGLWRMATDWADYAFQMRDVLDKASQFANPYNGINPVADDPDGDRGGFAPRWDGRVMTNFEQRGIEAGRHIFDLVGQAL